MNIIFVCKRYYTGKDVIRHRFGRLYEIPTQLARLGHDILVLCLDYRNKNHQEGFTEQFGSGSVKWIIVPIRNILNFEFTANYRTIKSMQATLIIGSSDIPCLWLSRHLSNCLGAYYIVDLYDNYESFGQARIPWFKRSLRASIKAANAIIVVSSTLKTKIMRDYSPTGSVLVMNNGIDAGSFSIGDRLEARISLRLPLQGRLIGTAGNLSRMKGLDTVYDAWHELQETTENTYLVLAGKTDPKLPLPTGERVIYLGEILENEIVQLFRALDVGIVPGHDSAFGRYCFPQKLFEMIACGLPVVAAKVGAIEDALHMNPAILFAPGDHKILAKTINLQLEYPQLPNIKPMQWNELIRDIESIIKNLI
ncbi:glycosyltransferase family 4 protein [Halopseudomonas yangmingensis]|uniref:Glycosyltransferase involved in cell wall bisynthesis n=1 Tax=Halopseudomonas yangmingensis TaxID=1720063 RepID=A0A1I4NZ54_9GAMM|nr:glycosyltransferase family 4 protein [Halopseudomonas yangmingensis]SFM20577.1 Glycosyltransferase involved in cell wall bisynthesis [Halopseudomonas yangmingensis]